MCNLKKAKKVRGAPGSAGRRAVLSGLCCVVREHVCALAWGAGGVAGSAGHCCNSSYLLVLMGGATILGVHLNVSS